MKKTLEYKGYTITLKKGRIYINGQPARKSARIILSFGNESILKMPKDTPASEFKEAGAEVFDSAEDFLRHLGCSDEEVTEVLHGMSLRSRKYLNKIKEDIGLIDIKWGHDGAKFETKYCLKVWANLTGSGGVNCGQTDDGNWIAEFSFRTDIDDFVICTMRFRKKPTKDMVVTAKLVDSIEGILLWAPQREEFKCWECGIRTHWLDINADNFEDRVERWKDKYCGC